MINLFLKKHTPRWIIFFIDIFICLISILLAYLLRFNFDIPQVEVDTLYYVLPAVLFIRILSFLIGKTYAGIIRYTSTKDAERIFLVILSGSVLLIIGNIIRYFLFDKVFLVPFSIIIIDFIASVFLLTALRLLVKILFMELYHPKKERTDIIIYGVDQLAMITKRTIDRDQSMNYRVIAFIDDSLKNAKNKLEGVTIYNLDSLSELLEKNQVAKLIIAKSEIEKKTKNEVIDICLQHNILVLTVPEASSWINGELSFNQIKNIRIEDLLGRAPIKLNSDNIKKELLNNNILITGAAGSIGSEVVRQLIKFYPKKVILYDQAESPLYELETELSEKFGFNDFEVVIGDINNRERLELVFNIFKPAVVYHAAAYKHVPMMENNPAEAITTNVIGTKHVADLAVKYKADKFVMISTDKAVNPTNVMGASKRIAEIYSLGLNKRHDTSFVITRFGNVLGSNGSVIPRFRKQIETGGPITITHPDVTRYFMTIPEACQLVLEAGSMGRGGEIFLFDMGESVRIIDLAKKMIKLSGLELGKDINILYTGLRPGEKLYEELLCNAENSQPTYHPQIMIAKDEGSDYEDFSSKIQELFLLTKSFDNFKIVEIMKSLVPEFISKNSPYESLDSQQ